MQRGNFSNGNPVVMNVIRKQDVMIKKQEVKEFINWLQENSTDYRNDNSIRDSRANNGVE